jgi:riboflavin synthase
MFTGIVREIGRIASLEGDEGGIRLEIDAPRTAPGIEIGGSVAVNGVCLTADALDDGRIGFHAVPETLRRTTLGTLAPGASVNIEPALRAGDAMGGHVVQGHVDGVGRVRSVETKGADVRVTVEAAEEVLRYCVEKGSIAVEGVSLTIAELEDDAFTLALIPHTLAETTLAGLTPGGVVNLEVDVLAKYVERLVARR